MRTLAAFVLLLVVSLAASGQSSNGPAGPSVQEFPKELARNFRGLWDGDNLTPVLMGGFASGSSVLLDDRIQRYFLQERRAKLYGNTGDVAGGPYVVGGMVGGLFLLGRAVEDNRFRAMTYSLAQASVMTFSVDLAVKGIARRERPDRENKLSFPSSHAANAFTWATVVSRYYGTRAAIPSYLAAAFVSSSRLEKNKHHLSDVVAGATIGYIVGRTVSRRRPGNEPGRLTWNVMPLRGGGLGISAQVFLGRQPESNNKIQSIQNKIKRFSSYL